MEIAHAFPTNDISSPPNCALLHLYQVLHLLHLQRVLFFLFFSRVCPYGLVRKWAFVSLYPTILTTPSPFFSIASLLACLPMFLLPQGHESSFPSALPLLTLTGICLLLVLSWGSDLRKPVCFPSARCWMSVCTKIHACHPQLSCKVFGSLHPLVYPNPQTLTLSAFHFIAKGL